MKITFANPEMNVCHVVVGEHEGRALSSFITLNRGEIDFLHKYKTSSQSSAPTFHTFLRSREDDSCVTCLHVISVSKTNFTEIEAQELGGKIFAAASASIFPVPASSAQSREQPPLLIEPSFTQSSFSAVPVAPTIVPEEDQQMADVVLDFSTVWDPTIVANIALGFRIRSFSFTKYITKNNSAAKEFGQVFIMSSNNRITEQVYSDLVPIADAVDLARELSSEPPNVLSPEAMVKVARDLKRFGVKTEILEEKDMKKLGMEALLSVGQGSANESFMAICQWHGGHQDDAPIALVGKGVTFDSGGISIKPSNNMHEMKEDMTGAAVVLATLQMAAQLKLPVNLIGVVGLVENMPSGTAMRPSDVVSSMSGQTIEVQNTDAEGRLVLADALFYVSDQFKPQCIIDFATLTGAIQVALGSEFAGLFSNNDNLSKLLIETGEQVHERLWRMPLDKAYEEDIDSEIADVKNVGAGRGASSITAAQFLQRFVSGAAWAHVDIAAVAHDKKERPITGKGFTGFGVRLMYVFLDAVFKKHIVFCQEENK